MPSSSGERKVTDTDLHDSSPSSAQRFGWFTTAERKIRSTYIRSVRDGRPSGIICSQRTSSTTARIKRDSTIMTRRHPLRTPIANRNQTPQLVWRHDSPSSSSDPVAPDNRKPLRDAGCLKMTPHPLVRKRPTDMNAKIGPQQRRKRVSCRRAAKKHHVPVQATPEHQSAGYVRFGHRMSTSYELGTGRQHILTDRLLESARGNSASIRP